MSDMCPIYVIYLPHIFHLFAPYVSCICPMYVIHLPHICHLFAPYMSFICPICVIYLPHMCLVFAPCMSFICPIYVIYLPHTSYLFAPYVLHATHASGVCPHMSCVCHTHTHTHTHRSGMYAACMPCMSVFQCVVCALCKPHTSLILTHCVCLM
jgi:hypothetical protein